MVNVDINQLIRTSENCTHFYNRSICHCRITSYAIVRWEQRYVGKHNAIGVQKALFNFLQILQLKI